MAKNKRKKVSLLYFRSFPVESSHQENKCFPQHAGRKTLKWLLLLKGLCHAILASF